MTETINQAVLFTKPVHHLDLELTAEQLAGRTRAFFEAKGFNIVCELQLTGADLSTRDVIKEHYLMYSRAACSSSVDALAVTEDGKRRFEEAFGKAWAGEAGKVLGSPALQQAKGISSHELYLLWNEQFSARKTCKIQDGVILAWLAGLDCYCINAFYPAMEENFYHTDTEMAYYVVEFDPEQVSWLQFRKTILGVTDASRAEAESFRGTLYSEFKVDFPGRDNFVHGSAGPLEGLVERTIHEPDFGITENPVGRVLAKRGITLERFKAWKSSRTISQLGEIFDATEEQNTVAILPCLDDVQF